MQTISVPKETKFVEFQLDLDNDGKNDVLIELQFIERTQTGHWGFVVILPDRTVTGKINSKETDVWVGVEIELNHRRIIIEVIRDPEDNYMMILLR